MVISKGESEYGPTNIGVNNGMKLQIDVFGRAGQSMVLGKGVQTNVPNPMLFEQDV